MATVITGQSTTGLRRTREGWREYTLISLVKGELTDGPFAALSTPGLPQPGDPWNYRGDSDPWAFCSPEADVKPHGRKETEPGNWWAIEQKFTNRPDAGHCKDQSIEDPLLQPDDISGSFTRFTEEAVEDKDGEPILTSSHEVVRGPQVEFDAIRAVVKIKQNRAALELELLARLANSLNDREMWGLPPRCIKFLPAGWLRKFWGACSVYYERSLEFEVRVKVGPGGFMESGFDRVIRDEGTMCLNGSWDRKTRKWILKDINGKPPDKTNPLHFIRATDVNATPIRVLLDGEGKPWNRDPPLTTGCSQCLDGAPLKWRVTGLGDGFYRKFNGAVMAYEGGCLWSFELDGGAGGRVTLQFEGGEWFVDVVTEDGGPVTGRWSRPAAGWECKGKNELAIVEDFVPADEQAGAPETISVTPAGGTEPGQISVQRYQEGNLFLLGIPSVLG